MHIYPTCTWINKTLLEQHNCALNRFYQPKLCSMFLHQRRRAKHTRSVDTHEWHCRVCIRCEITDLCFPGTIVLEYMSYIWHVLMLAMKIYWTLFKRNQRFFKTLPGAGVYSYCLVWIIIGRGWGGGNRGCSHSRDLEIIVALILIRLNLIFQIWDQSLSLLIRIKILEDYLGLAPEQRMWRNIEHIKFKHVLFC